MPLLTKQQIIMIDAIPGWMSEGELQWLADTASIYESWTELGSYCGRSMTAVGLGIKSGGILRVVDKEISPTLLNNISRLRKLRPDIAVESYQMSTAEAAMSLPDSAVVFIDADHSYESVKADLKAWANKCKLICGHDYQPNYAGVIKAVNESMSVQNPVGDIWIRQLPVDTEEFWQSRLIKASAAGNPYQALLHCSPEVWSKLQNAHKKILADLLKPRPAWKILDAGCGLGLFLDILPGGVDITYTGVDFVADFITAAAQRYPTRRFIKADLKSLQFGNNEFDLVICRGVEGVVTGQLGRSVWKQIEAELLRVAPVLALFNCNAESPTCQILHSNSTER